MAQTTGSITGKDMTIQVSTDGVTYTDISGSTNNVEPGGGTRKTGSQHTFEGDTPLVGAGKKEATTVKMKIIYTEDAGEAAALIKDYHDNNTPCYLRYRPKGDTAGNWQFTGGPGYFTTPVFPKLDSDNATPVLVDTSWFGPELAQSAIPA